MKLIRIFLSFCIAAAVSLAAGADVSPKLRLEFCTQPNDNQEVRDFFAQFAHVEGFEIVDWTQHMPQKDGRPIVNIKLNKGNTATVIVNDIIRENQYFVGVYETEANNALGGITSRLRSRLTQKWPSTKLYQDSSEVIGGDCA